MALEKQMECKSGKTKVSFGGVELHIGIPEDTHFNHISRVGIEIPSSLPEAENTRLMDIVFHYLRKNGIGTVSERADDPLRPKTYDVFVPNSTQLADLVSSDDLQKKVITLLQDEARKAVKPGSDFAAALTQLEAHVAKIPEPKSHVGRLVSTETQPLMRPREETPDVTADSHAWLRRVIRLALPRELDATFDTEELTDNLVAAVKSVLPNINEKISRQELEQALENGAKKTFRSPDTEAQLKLAVERVTGALSQQLNVMGTGPLGF